MIDGTERLRSTTDESILGVLQQLADTGRIGNNVTDRKHPYIILGR